MFINRFQKLLFFFLTIYLTINFVMNDDQKWQINKLKRDQLFLINLNGFFFLY